jgi:hypothetical protein
MKSNTRNLTAKMNQRRDGSASRTLGEFDYFEVMDRAAMAANNIETNIGAHPVVEKDARLKQAYETLSDALGAFYQAAGSRFFEISESADGR